MSLHTKHRPNNLSEIIGQDQAVKSLKQVVAGGRAHSFIFSGPSGTGKTTLARILADLFAGKEATVANRIAFPASEKSGKDDVKRVIESTRYRALGKSQTKTVIVDEAHRLSGAAWDAFLEPVEEPQEHVYWIFCTTEPGKIPKAIQTRCLKYDLKPVPEELIFELLLKVVEAESLEISDEILEAIAENSGGSPRQALVYLEACLYCESANDARQIMRAAGQSKEIIDLARWLVAGRALNWAEAVKYVKSLDGNIEAESARLVIMAYLTSTLMGTKDDKRAKYLLSIMEAFSKSYNSSEKFGPLLMSVAMAIGMDQ